LPLALAEDGGGDAGELWALLELLDHNRCGMWNFFLWCDASPIFPWFLVSEAIREQVLHHTKRRSPHSTAVVIEQFEEGPKLTRIAAAIFCEREGQRRSWWEREAKC